MSLDVTVQKLYSHRVVLFKSGRVRPFLAAHKSMLDNFVCATWVQAIVTHVVSNDESILPASSFAGCEKVTMTSFMALKE